MLGLDLKPDVVAECEALARRLDAAGSASSSATSQRPTSAVSTSSSACTRATRRPTPRSSGPCAPAPSVILAVPCCQHELSAQLSSEVLRPLLRHGTLKERFAAEVTDAARARLLEIAGYDVQVVEFVPLEHTPKNVLLRATRTSARRATGSDSLPSTARSPTRSASSRRSNGSSDVGATSRAPSSLKPPGGRVARAERAHPIEGSAAGRDASDDTDSCRTERAGRRCASSSACCSRRSRSRRPASRPRPPRRRSAAPPSARPGTVGCRRSARLLLRVAPGRTGNGPRS